MVMGRLGWDGAGVAAKRIRIEKQKAVGVRARMIPPQKHTVAA
jgi:hypothetical protein